jgi:hypothetical protein
MTGVFERRERRETAVEASIESADGREKLALLPLHVLKTIGCFLLISVVCFAAYANTLHVPFIWDDIYNITENPVVHDLDNFTSSLSGYNQNPRRFVGYFTFALNYAAGGTDVRGYHIVNLIIHIVNGCLLYLLVILTFRTPCFASWKAHSSSGASPVTDYGSRFIALFTALFFVSHPVQTQAVTYIVQRLTSLAT